MQISHFLFEYFLVFVEELFENIVDEIADAAGLVLLRTDDTPYHLNKVGFYADFRETTVKLVRIPAMKIGSPKSGTIGLWIVCVVNHK